MNILFDLITTYKATGASEYVRRVWYALLNAASESYDRDIKIVGLYDSQKGKGTYEDMSVDSLQKQEICCVDIHSNKITDIIKDYNIDVFFIGCAQYLGGYDGIQDVQCKVICVVHDLSFEEKANADIDLWLKLPGSKARFLYNWVKYKYKGYPYLNLMESIRILAMKNDNVKIIAVSEYTKSSIKYFLGLSDDCIEVLYSPEKCISPSNTIENDKLRDLIKSQKKYFLMLHAEKPVKNVQKAINAFKRFVESNPAFYLITLGAKVAEVKNQIILPRLSDADLQAVYANCYAFVYPSLFEGFGYPPMEAMRYGKPVLCSNTTSIPEICGDAPIYFSPIYESDIYKAYTQLVSEDYWGITEKSKERFRLIHEKQENDLHKLLNIILE